ncbi:17.8 kDa class I heat shock protein-like [Humulus lupulus]|uniref:17.8 kDa class I heat shock protein-like n=1 Tax=Humulus lupulus TaxID=3486 RepID=UPI002B414542|nr:17.8 kDa class I heat shock protein-like [Humulus lupulus]
METTATIADTYVDFEPYCAWLRDEQSHTIAIHLHGFKREQLRVQINNQRIVTINGQRLVDEGNKVWSRFSKQLKLPEDCSDYGIRARFSAGVLTITMPKQLPSASASPINTLDDHHQRRRFDDTTDQQEKSSSKEPKSSSPSSCSQNNYNKNSSVLLLAATVAAIVLVLAVSGASYVFKHTSSSSTPTN